VQAFLGQVRGELHDKDIHAYHTIHVVYGQKPERDLSQLRPAFVFAHGYPESTQSFGGRKVNFLLIGKYKNLLPQYEDTKPFWNIK
jgi:hypothetical protein